MAIAYPSNPSGMQGVDFGQNGIRTVFVGVSGASICCWVEHDKLPTGAPPAGGAVFNWAGFSIGTPTNGSANAGRLELETITGTTAGARIRATARASDSEAANFATGTSQFAVPMGETHHIACVADFKDGTLAVYLDGNLANRANVTYTQTSTSNLNPRGGSSGVDLDLASTGEALFGRLEDVRYYDVALSDDEIKTIAGCRGTDGIYRVIRSRYEMLDQPTGTIAPTGSIRDNSIDQFAVNGWNKPSYNGSLTTKYRRRLP